MRRRTQGFTLVEVGVCIAITLLLAAIVYPNMVREADVRAHREFKIKLRTYVQAAKTRAIETRTTVALNYDKNSKSLSVVENDDKGATKPLPDLALPSDVDATQFAADAQESPSDSWRVPFYADGSTTGGAIQFQYGDLMYSMVIDRNTGETSVIDGRLPDMSNETWPAGGLQKRA